MKKLIDAIRPNPFDKLLKKMVREEKKRFLIVWSRGMGDIPLGLYALIYRIRSYIPHASITFMTRKDLAEAFTMLEGVQVLVGKSWKRGKPVDIEETLRAHCLSSNMFDVVLEKPDPTKWLKWQIGSLTPKLKWEQEWDSLVDKYQLDPNKIYIGCHVQTETSAYYRYEKNWDLASWRDLFKKIQENEKGTILLFGLETKPAFLMKGVIDLRGKTTLFDMLSLIKNRCQYLIAPDSGVLSMTYYVDASYPIRAVSLWADPRQGILRQKVDSPNPQFKHIPLHGRNDCVANISVASVYNSLFG